MRPEDFRKSLRTRNLYNPTSTSPFKLSRARLETFIQCPRCFYMDRRLGLETPSIPSFTLNSAVDELLKKEFDDFRFRQKPHPLMSAAGIEAIPWQYEKLDDWRNNFKGIQHWHKLSNLIITGAVDDIWMDGRGQLLVVDYKATSTVGPISLDSEYRQAYKRQMEIYQWLLMKEGFPVSSQGYFVYCNGDRSKVRFDAKLEFDIQIIPYVGNFDWVEEAVLAAQRCLSQDDIPTASSQCAYCLYRRTAEELEKGAGLRGEIQPELF